MAERETWTITYGRRYGTSYAQLQSIIDCLIEGEDILVMCLTHKQALDDCSEVAWELKAKNVYFQQKITDLHALPPYKGSIKFITFDRPEIYRGLRPTRCFITCDHPKRVEFTQEYLCTFPRPADSHAAAEQPLPPGSHIHSSKGTLAARGSGSRQDNAK